jgi:hypothetical protein
VLYECAQCKWNSYSIEKISPFLSLLLPFNISWNSFGNFIKTIAPHVQYRRRLQI